VHAGEKVFAGLHGHRFAGGGIGRLDQVRGQFLEKRRGVAGQHLAIAFAARTVAEIQCPHRAGNGHVEQAPLRVQGALDLRARMGQQAFLGAVNMGIVIFSTSRQGACYTPPGGVDCPDEAYNR
jgi:hypothetical protein